MAIYGYARVSTTDQHLGVQLAQLRAAGCDEIFQEKVSGAKDDRPELLRMMRAVNAGDVVAVCKIDRIARSTMNLSRIIEDLKKKGASFRVLNINLDTSTATGKMMLNMLGVIAEFERDIMLERQREGIEDAKKAGKYKGRAPIAMRQSARVLELLAGGASVAQVAVELGMGETSVYRIKKAAEGV